jgi:hypothetical protein
MAGRDMYELDRIWRYGGGIIEIKARNVPGGNVENNEEPQAGQLILWPRFERRISYIQD